jgi:hypothetical protein
LPRRGCLVGDPNNSLSSQSQEIASKREPALAHSRRVRASFRARPEWRLCGDLAAHGIAAHLVECSLEPNVVNAGSARIYLSPQATSGDIPASAPQAKAQTAPGLHAGISCP